MHQLSLFKFTNLVIVDQDLSNLEYLANGLLSDEKYIIHKAQSLHHVYQIIDNERIDLLIMDYHLGEKEILELFKDFRIPTILITDSNGIDIAIQAMKLGVNDCVNKDGEGKYLEILEFAIKRLERELNQNHFKHLAERTPDCVIMLDRFGKFTYANPKWSDVTGYKLEELCGGQFDFFDLVSFEKEKALIRELINNCWPVHSYLKFCITTSDRHHIYMEGSMCGRRNYNEPLIFTLRDVSERKKLESEILDLLQRTTEDKISI